MWHEARKQERKIRGLLVDYRKRAERRQNFYEKIKADPTQFLQIHGRKCKIHIDLNIAMAAENPKIMMPWLGQKDNMIDRFDARAHLDHIPPPPAKSVNVSEEPDEGDEASTEERMINYERYRVLAQNDFLGMNEEKYLYQLCLEELYGVNAQLEHIEKQSKKKSNAGAAIAYTYEDNDTSHQPFVDKITAIETAAATSSKFDDCVKDESDSDLDMDMSIDINKIGHQQGHELNTCGRHYGMKSNDFYSFLTRDADEMETLRLAREEEQEKIIFSGRKSRRERRAQRERRYAVKGTTSPPSYAAKDDILDGKLEEKSVSRSPTPENSGKVVFITSFGGEEELQPHPKISINFNRTGGGASTSKSTAGSLGALLAENRGVSYADTLKQNISKLKDLDRSEPTAKKPMQYQGRRHSRSRSHSRDRYGRRYGPSKSRRYSRSRSRSRRRSRSTSRRRWRSRSRSSGRRKRSSRSRSNARNSHRHSSSSSSSRSSPDINERRRPTRARSKSPTPRKPVIKYSSSALLKFPPPPPPPPPPRPKSKSVERKLNIVVPPVTQEPPQPVVQQEMALAMEPVPPIKRYYGRKREDSSSNSSEDSTEDEPKEIKVEPMDTSEPGDNCSLSENQTNSFSRFGKSTGSPDTKVVQSSSSLLQKVNPRDRLKRKMQILLNKQYKADKKAETEKNERQIQQQQEREDEMRELALRLRKRQRELRHRYGTPSNSESDDSDDSDSQRLARKNGDSNRSSSSNSTRSSPSPKRPDRVPSRTRSRSRSRGGRYGHKRSVGRSRSRSRDQSSRVYNRRSRSRTRVSPNNSSRHGDSRRRSRERRRSRSVNQSRDHRDSNNRTSNKGVGKPPVDMRDSNRSRVTIRRSPVLQRPPIPTRKLVDY